MDEPMIDTELATKRREHVRATPDEPRRHVYANDTDGGTDWFIATSVEQAGVIAREFYAQALGVPVEDIQLDPLTLVDEDTQTTSDDEPGGEFAFQTCGAWAEELGLGFFTQTGFGSGLFGKFRT